jgi:hypothetical protein
LPHKNNGLQIVKLPYPKQQNENIARPLAFPKLFLLQLVFSHLKDFRYSNDSTSKHNKKRLDMNEGKGERRNPVKDGRKSLNEVPSL